MSNFSKISSDSLTEKQLILGLLVGAIILYTVSLGNLAIRDWDEGYYTIVARDMYRTGNWLYPTYLGDPFLLKPPLMHWLVALSYHLGGVNEFTSRLPTALLSAGSIPLIYLLGKEAFSQRLPALFSALVYLTLLPVVRNGRLAMLDGMSITFFLITLLCLIKAKKQPTWAVGIGISLGLIGLTKGILVLLLGAIATIFLLANSQLLLLANPYLWLGLIIGSLPLFSWYFAQWQHYGEIFLQVHFQAQGFERINNAVWGNTGPPWFYILELLKYSFPWLLFFPSGLHLAWQKRHTPWGKLVLIGFCGYMGIISVMGTKLPWYILPAYIFFALAIGSSLNKLWHSRNYPLWLTTAFALLSFASIGGLVYFILADPQIPLILLAVVVAITMGLAAWQVQQNRPTFIPLLFVGTYLSLGLLMISQSWIWELNEAFRVKPVAALIKENTDPKIPVYISHYGRPSLEFYSDRLVIPLTSQNIEQLWQSKPYLLLDQTTLEQTNLPESQSLGIAAGFTLITPKE
ncbi:MAG: glycosyltransferase family 39 protein [Spirulinaceae cyanobacterium]